MARDEGCTAKFMLLPPNVTWSGTHEALKWQIQHLKFLTTMAGSKFNFIYSELARSLDRAFLEIVK